MADLGVVGETGNRLVQKVFSSIIWFGVALLIIGVVGFTLWFFVFYRRKFDIKIKIISHRSGESNSVIFDKAAILTDWKTKLPYLKIWNLKRSFMPPKYDIIQNTNEGDYIEMFRKSEDEFYFLTPPVINKERILDRNGVLIAIADQGQIMMENDMAFWSVKRKSQNKGMFDLESIFMKILPYFPHIIGGVLTIFVLYVLMDHLPGILSQLQKLAEAMTTMQRAEITTG